VDLDANARCLVLNWIVNTRGVLLEFMMLLGLKPGHTCDSIPCLTGVRSLTVCRQQSRQITAGDCDVCDPAPGYVVVYHM
jgi:hypothetical protein